MATRMTAYGGVAVTTATMPGQRAGQPWIRTAPLRLLILGSLEATIRESSSSVIPCMTRCAPPVHGRQDG
jgi:hypothetical protein